MKKVRKMNDEKIIEDAQKLYKKGKWAEAIDIIDKLLTTHNKQEIVEANRIKGWSYYYLGIKGNENYKMKNLEKAEEYFELSLVGAKEDRTKISILNGLPLVLWILGKKQESLQLSVKATEEFPDIPSVWNTKSILNRWGKDFQNSVEVCEKVYKTSLIKEDFRTAGHGKQNRGDALVKLGKTTEAKEDYEKALEMYKKYEKKTGESASFHLERVREKLSNL